MIENNYVFNIEQDAKLINKIINEFNAETKRKSMVSALKFQFKMYEGNFKESKYADFDTIGCVYGYDVETDMSYFRNTPLENMVLKPCPKFEIPSNLVRTEMFIRPAKLSSQSLNIKF